LLLYLVFIDIITSLKALNTKNTGTTINRI